MGSINARRCSTTAEKIKIHALLVEHLTAVSPGFCVYKEGHSDKTIAALVSADLPDNSVAAVRKETFGHLRLRPEKVAAPEGETLHAAVARLTEAVNWLLAEAGRRPIEPVQLDLPVKGNSHG